jgi:hypothetical protein
MNTEIARGVRRARRFAGVGSALIVGSLLPILLTDGPLAPAVKVLFYAGLAIGIGLGTFAWTLELRLRREQRRLDREAYRRLMSGQRMN